MTAPEALPESATPVGSIPADDPSPNHSRKGISEDNVLDYINGKMEIYSLQGLQKSDLEALYIKGCELYEAQAFREARELFDHLCLLDRSDSRFWLSLGCTLQMLGQFREALFPLRMAHFLNETDSDAAFQISECQLALGEKEQAAASLLLVQSSSAQHSALHTRATELLKELNRAQIPLPGTEQITHQGPTDAGKTPLATAGDRNEGVVTDEELPENIAYAVYEILSKGESIYPYKGMTKEQIEFIYFLAHARYSEGKFEQAEKIFRGLCLLDAAERKHWFGLGATLQMQKHYQTATEPYEVAQELDPGDPVPSMQIYECWIASDDVSKAAESLRKVLSMTEGKEDYKPLHEKAASLLQTLQQTHGALS